ncbi:MAG: hypothetical protein IJP92_15735, partial [Lachnospiraceae bacterium]|nr:hypothetical protein [Lachnospiraceae bacterium]
MNKKRTHLHIPSPLMYVLPARGLISSVTELVSYGAIWRRIRAVLICTTLVMVFSACGSNKGGDVSGREFTSRPDGGYIISEDELQQEYIIDSNGNVIFLGMRYDRSFEENGDVTEVSSFYTEDIWMGDNGILAGHEKRIEVHADASYFAAEEVSVSDFAASQSQNESSSAYSGGTTSDSSGTGASDTAVKHYEEKTIHTGFIIKEGQKKIVTDQIERYVNGQNLLYLCPSGSVLFFTEDNTLYRFDTESEKKNAILPENHNLISGTSYNGNVVWLSDGTVIIGDKSFKIPYGYIEAASENGERIYCTIYDPWDDVYKFGIVNGTDVQENRERYEPHVVIKESQVVWIAAASLDYSEIIFLTGEGDCYYYSTDEGLKLLAQNALLAPIASLESIQRHDVDPIVPGWRLEYSGLSDICNKIDQKHGVSTIKNQLYCQFKTGGRGNNMASIVYLRDDLSQEVLVEDIARDPIVSTDGKYTWCVTDND